MTQDTSEIDIGTCCFCGNECNPCSQSCGSCARSLSGYTIGLNTLPDHLYDYMITGKVSDDDNFRDEQFNGQIYYTGIGSTPETQYMDEITFRRTIWMNRENFHEECPHDPRTCSLRILVKWTGANLVTS